MEIEGIASFEETETRDREARIAVEDVPSTEAMTQLYFSLFQSEWCASVSQFSVIA